jgi:hypothetical protein
VKPGTTKPKPGAGGQAEGGPGGSAGTLAFTGPTSGMPVIVGLAGFLFMTGLAFLWLGRHRGRHRAS